MLIKGKSFAAVQPGHNRFRDLKTALGELLVLSEPLRLLASVACPVPSFTLGFARPNKGAHQR